MNRKTTFILALAVLATAALIYAYRDQLSGQAPPAPKPAEASPLVEDVAPADVVAVTLEAKAADGTLKTKLALKKADGQWRTTAPIDGPADDAEVMRLIRAATEAKVADKVKVGAAGQPTLESIGLEPPAFKLTLATEAVGKKPAKTVVVDIGKKSTLSAGVYAKLLAPEKTALLDKADLLERAAAGINEYRGHTLYKTPGESLVRIEVSGPKGPKVRFDRAEDRGWVLAEPLAARADPDTASTIARDIDDLRVKDFVADAPKDLARFGLATPVLTVTLWEKGKEPPKPIAEAGKPEAKPPAKVEPVKIATLKFGSYADLEKKDVHATADDGHHVVAVPANLLKDLDKPAQDFRDKHVLALDTAKVSRVTVKNKDGEFEILKTAGKWRVKVPNRPEADADQEAVDALLKEAADLKVIYFGDEKEQAAGLGTPTATLKLQVEGEPNPRGYEVNGTPGSRTVVKNLREDWIGGVNEKDLAWLPKAWFAYLDKTVLKLDPKKIQRVLVAAPDKTVTLEQKDGKWKMTQPIAADPDAQYGDGLAHALEHLDCTAYVAATADTKPYKLETGSVVVTVTSAPEKEGEKPVEKTLRLALQDNAKVYGRVDGSDLVFEVPAAVRTTLAEEPLAKDFVTLTAAEVADLVITQGQGSVHLIKKDERWYRADAAGKPEKEVEGDAAKNLVTDLAALKAKRWAAYDTKALPDFGLDKPALSIKATAGEKSQTLLVSEKELPPALAELVADKPARYAMLQGGERVALIAGPPIQNILGIMKALEGKPAVKEEPKAEAPKAEGPKVEAPKVEAPKVEAPKVEAPKVDEKK